MNDGQIEIRNLTANDKNYKEVGTVYNLKEYNINHGN